MKSSHLQCHVCGLYGRLTALWAYELPNGDVHNERVHRPCREKLQKRSGIIPASGRASDLVTA